MTLLFLLAIVAIALASGRPIQPHLLERRVDSRRRKLTDADENGDCYYPPFCRLDITRCNIDKIPLHEMTASRYLNDYYYPRKPVIVELYNQTTDHCAFEHILDNSTQIFNLKNIAQTVLDGRTLIKLRFQEKMANVLARQSMTAHEEVDPRYSAFYKSLYSAFRRPSFVTEFDVYNDLLGFLSSSDAHSLLSNRWLIFGAISGGATFHADVYGVALMNALIEGAKFWVLTEPEDTLRVFDGSVEAVRRAQFLSNFEWFNDIFVDGWLDAQYQKKVAEGRTHFHCLQTPGDVLIAPELFYHITVNVEHSWAVAQGLMTKDGFQNYTAPLFGSSEESPHKLLDRGRDDHFTLRDGMQLCVAMFWFDAQLWETSVCNDPKYRAQLAGTKYEEALRHAKHHARFTDFL